ncbi:MAG: hypothetical protein AT710_07280 [Thermocladium sp. ECH_B]|nr:MAG: hypothetical protein AT710_07280 [Thermocladium sp. ECH_B]
MLLRSMLYIPANKPKYIQSALSLQNKPDAVILDLEDGVPHDQKDSARQLIPEEAKALRSAYPTFIRINSYGSRWFDDDLKVVTHCDGVLLPKATPEGVAAIISRLTAMATPIPIIPLIESAVGVVTAHEMASMKHVTAIGFGAGDLAIDLGLTWSKDGLEYSYARMKMPVDAAAAGIVAIDGVYMDLDDLEGFERDSSISRRLGFKGRQVVHPNQVPIANKVYAPTESEVNWARKVVQEYEKAALTGIGAIRVDNELVDYMHYRMAKRILDTYNEIIKRNQ